MWTRHRLDWHARLSQPREVSFHGAQAHSELPCERGTRHRLLDCTEKLDKPLLPFHPSKSEVVIT
jgi:hypothetical protein